jgi:hypothetical protein
METAVEIKAPYLDHKQAAAAAAQVLLAAMSLRAHQPRIVNLVRVAQEFPLAQERLLILLQAAAADQLLALRADQLAAAEQAEVAAQMVDLQRQTLVLAVVEQVLHPMLAQVAQD